MALYRGTKMEVLKIESIEQQQYLPRSRLEELCAQSPDQNRSPRMTKKANPKNQKHPPEPAFDMRKLPTSLVNDLGIDGRTQMWLEVCPVFASRESCR